MPELSRLRAHGTEGSVMGTGLANSIVAHHSLATGRFPSGTGIVGDRLHLPENSFYWYTSALELSSSAESIWDRAQQAGLATAALFWPGAQPGVSDSLPDYTVGYGKRLAYSTLHNMDFYGAQGWTGSENQATHSPLRESQFRVTDDDGALLATIYVLASDQTDDNTPNYDTFILSPADKIIQPEDGLLQTGQGSAWATVRLDPALGIGADFLLLDSSLDTFTLYQSRVYQITAAPDDFRQAFVEQFATFPPPPDFYALEHGWITELNYMEMLRRQSEWMSAASIWVYENYAPDLLLTVQSPLDQAGYQFLLVDERQPGYTRERAAEYSDYRAEAAAILDESIGQIGQAVAGDNTTLFIVGTSGLAAIHTQVNINIALAQAGLLALDYRNYVIVGQSQAMAVGAGGSAYIYINLAGRERSGIVSEEAYSEVQDEIVRTLNDLVDPTTGEPILTRVVRRADLAELGLDAPLAGDIFIQAYPGYTLSDDRSPDDIFTQVNFYGQQGYDPHLDVMQGGWYAVGSGIHTASTTSLAQYVDFAPTIASLLGFEMDVSNGQVIEAFLNP